MLLCMIGTAVFVRWVRRSNKNKWDLPRGRLFAAPLVMLVLVGIGIAGYMRWNGGDLERLSLWTLGCCIAIGPGAYYVVQVVFRGMVKLEAALINRHIYRRHPISSFVLAAKESLDLVLSDTLPWGGIAPYLAKQLLLGSTLLEDQIPRRLRTGNVVHDAWVSSQFALMGNWMVELCRWTATPMERTRSDIADQLTKLLIASSRGHWDAIPRRDQGHMPFRSRIAVTWFALRHFVVAILPLAASVGVRMTIPESQSFINYFIAAAVGWLIVCAVVSMDPAVSAKLEILRAAIPTFTGRKD
jgi:hypothetical protein